MGGGPEKHFPILIEDDEVHPLGCQVNAFIIGDKEDNAYNTINKLDDPNNEKESVLEGDDVDSAMDEPRVSTHKQELMMELKALGINPKQKPDYTKPLDEPSWGDSDAEADSDVDADVDVDVDADGVLDGEDESDEYGDDDVEGDEMVESIKAEKSGIVA